ncbi:MAG: sulfatase-like hydrolase/transferase [Fimbriimonadaceae bacterium]
MLVPLLSLSLPQSSPPNIVFIVSDDAGYGDFGFTGSLQIKTPNIDSIAKEGVEFTQGYVSGPVCSPSRAGFLTGRYQSRFGHEDNLAIGEVQPGDQREDIGLPVEERTIADYMKSFGYTTGLVGKWHLGEEEKFLPKSRGFDEYWFLPGGSRPYFDQKVGKAMAIQSNYDPEPKVTYTTDDFGAQAAGFITRNAKKPFFLYLSYTAPHTPLTPKPEDEEEFAYIADNRRRKYCGLMKGLDRSVGVVLDALKTNKLDQNTLVIFINDNGGQIQAGAVNAPYRGMKGTFLEGGTRIAYAMKWPGKIKAGTEFDGRVSTLDILPTALGAASQGKRYEVAKPFDGVDLMPYLAQAKSGDPHETLFWRMGFTGAVRDGD